MLRIGITGGIGSGKSTVAKIFSILDIPVYNADQAAQFVMEHDETVRTKIQNFFGKDVYKQGKPDRKMLAEIVFNDPKKLEQLNAVVHPATLSHSESWMQKQTSPYALKEAALIFETDAWKQLDYVIGVRCPETLRIQRSMKRDGISAEAVKARMQRQMDETEKMNLCDFIIFNDETRLVIPQVLELDEIFKSKAVSRS